MRLCCGGDRSSSVRRLCAAWLFVFAVGFAGSAVASDLSRGRAALEAGDFARAERELLQAVRSDPESASAFYHLGVAHAKQGDHGESVAALERALAIDPEYPRAHLLLGIGRYHLGRYAAAQGELERAAKSAPDDGTPYLFLGLNSQALGLHDEAIDYMEQAARADPEFAQLALYNVGLSHWKQGRADEAGEALERAAAVDPTSEVAADARALRDVVARAAENSRRWSLSGTAGTEYDSNVVQSEIDLLSGDFDVVGIFDLATSFQVVRTEHATVDVGYDFYQSLHQKETEFDVQSHGGSLSVSREFGWLDVGASYRFAYAMLDWNKLFLMHGARPNLAVSPVPWWYVEASYQYWRKDFADSARDADHHGLGLDQYFFFQEQRAHFRVGYRVATERADGSEFDFLGHFPEASLHLPVPFLGATEADLSYGYIIKDYTSVTPSIGEKRRDRRHRAQVGLTRRIYDILLVRIDYEFVLADSNLPSADFTQHVASVKLGFEF